MGLIDADILSKSIAEYFKDKLDNLDIREIQKIDDILQYNSDINKMIKTQKVIDYVTEDYIINVMATFREDIIVSAMENWNRAQVNMLKRLINAVLTHTPYEEADDDSSD